MAALHSVAILGKADHHRAAGLIGEPKRSGYLQERSSFAPDYSSQQVVLLGLHCSSQSLSRYKRDPWLHLEKSDSIFEWSNIWVKGLYHGFVRKWETREAFIIVTGSLVRTHARWDSNPVSRKKYWVYLKYCFRFCPCFHWGHDYCNFHNTLKRLYIAVTKSFGIQEVWLCSYYLPWTLVDLLSLSTTETHSKAQAPLLYLEGFYPQELSLCSQCEGCGDDGRLSHRKIINSTLIDCVNYVQDGLRLSMIASEVTSTNCQQTLSWCTTTISETRFIWNLALTKLVKFSVVTTRKTFKVRENMQSRRHH